jgi:hypothetical protein
MLVSCNAGILLTSYWIAIMGDKEPDANFKILLAFVSQAGLYISLITICISFSFLLFTSPKQGSASWLRKPNKIIKKS